MRKVAFRYISIRGRPVRRRAWADIKGLRDYVKEGGDVIEYAYALPVVTDEMVERACKAADCGRDRARAALAAALESQDAD